MHIMIWGWLGDWPQDRFIPIRIDVWCNCDPNRSRASRLPSSGTSKRRETESTKVQLWLHFFDLTHLTLRFDWFFPGISISCLLHPFLCGLTSHMGIKRGRTFFCQIARYLEAIWKLFQHVDKDDIGPRLRTAPKKHPETEDSAPETTKHQPKHQRNINETSTKHQPCFSGAQFLHFVAQGLAFSREMGYWWY